MASDKISVLYLQESCTDSIGSYVVFAPIDILDVSKLLSGGNPDYVAILPSGFVIFPDLSTMTGGTTNGSLLTIAFHIIDTATTQEYMPSKSMDTMMSIITNTVNSIKEALIFDT